MLFYNKQAKPKSKAKTTFDFLATPDQLSQVTTMSRELAKFSIFEDKQVLGHFCRKR